MGGQAEKAATASRIGKKRRLSDIIDAMLRLDVVYPQVRRLDEEFVQFILLVWLLEHYSSLDLDARNAVTRLFQPELDLRADDFDHVTTRLYGVDLSRGYGKWLHDYLSSGFPSDARARLLVRITALSGIVPDISVERFGKFLTEWPGA